VTNRWGPARFALRSFAARAPTGALESTNYWNLFYQQGSNKQFR
jgi:hypothetical protein